MSSLHFEVIKESLIKKHLKFNKGEKVDYIFADKVNDIEVTILFTNQDRAAWVAKFKRKYYGSIVSNIERKDEYTYIDIYKTLRENADESLANIN